MKQSWVYMTTNKNHTVIYTGVTSNLAKRILQHKTKFYKGFTSKYNCDKLVYYKEFSNIIEAIKYEKTIKAGSRAKKEKLINEMNPEWKDLSDGWWPASI
jgi:putative endonuclease